MITLYAKNGKAVNCNPDQVELMEKAGYSKEKPKAETVEGDEAKNEATKKAATK